MARREDAEPRERTRARAARGYDSRVIGWIYLASEWIIRVVMLGVVPRGRAPQAALAWLVIIFFLPWIGLAIYLLVGTRRLSARRAFQYHQAITRLGDFEREILNRPQVIQPEVHERQRDIVALAEKLSLMPVLGGNSAEFMTDTNDVIDRLIADIDEAREHVHLLFYIWRDDATGQRVAAALERAAQRGVKCRVMVDAVGSSGMLRALTRQLRRAGVEVRAALPVNPLRLLLARIDLRNHRKLVIIDGRTAYTGSQNIVDADYGGAKAGAWQDIMARLTGPIVVQLQLVFVEDWFAETAQLLDEPGIITDPSPTGGVPAQTIPSGPHASRGSVQDLFIAAIHEAEERVIITSPYFVPSESIIAALRIAAGRGVEVDIVTPERSDQRLVDAASRACYQELLDAGVRIHLHERGLLHAKTLTADRALALVGSANLDMRSFDLNFELTLALYGPEVTDLVREAQTRYMLESRRLDPAAWAARPARRTVTERLAALLGPLL